MRPRFIFALLIARVRDPHQDVEESDSGEEGGVGGLAAFLRSWGAFMAFLGTRPSVTSTTQSLQRPPMESAANVRPHREHVRSFLMVHVRNSRFANVGRENRIDSERFSKTTSEWPAKFIRQGCAAARPEWRRRNSALPERKIILGTVLKAEKGASPGRHMDLTAGTGCPRTHGDFGD